jgi:phage terminase large subunit-like protein
MLMFGLRLGDDPRAVVTTTPKPIKIIRELIADPTTVITRGLTYDNRANLAPAFLQQIVRKYEGTRLGRQELNAEILDDVPGALWSRALIEETRWPVHRKIPALVRIVVAIDPAVSTGEDADETGIIVAGKDADGHGYVLADQSPPDMRRPNGPAPRSRCTASTKPIGLWPRSTTAGIWLRAQSG